MNEEMKLDSEIIGEEITASEADEAYEADESFEVGSEMDSLDDGCVKDDESYISPENELLELERALPDMKINPAFTNGERYAQLRSLGLTAKEAYFAVASSSPRPDNRAHLSTSVPRAARSPHGAMSPRELEAAREIFFGLSDRQIEDLYRKVTK